MNKKLLILVIILIILIIILTTMGIFSFFNKNGPKISKEKALELVALELKNKYGEDYDFSRFNISISFQDDLWYVKYENKNPEPTINGSIGGGFIYAVNPEIGNIVYLGPINIRPSDIPKPIETKTFSEIPGFSFEYPVFKGWEPNEPEINKNNETGSITATIFFNNPTGIKFELGPRITIVKSFNTDYRYNVPGLSPSINPNKVKYYPIGGYESDQSNSIIFFNNDDSLAVKITPFMHEGDGYSEKVLVQKIIDSFRFENSSKITEVQALQIAKTDAIKAYGDLSPYNVVASLKADGWHVDYELKDPITTGGGPHYVIDSKTGEIISKRYEQ
ncbi:hypothetical protein KKG36_00195 [Patescibacteria group bacterium]|nr:hypothetical protein [Patescibacteria group bacterium]